MKEENVGWHLEISFAVLPFLVSAGPHGHVGGVHDGDKDVEHEDDHDDLVHGPDADANKVGELIGPVLWMFPSLNHLNIGRAVRFECQPEHFAPKVFRRCQLTVT